MQNFVIRSTIAHARTLVFESARERFEAGVLSASFIVF
jgi:hypothetical protein